jgi:hypothetical protein
MATPESAGVSIAARAERLSAGFAQSLADIMRKADAALKPILARAIAGDRTATVQAARGIALRRQIRQALTDAGFDDFATEASNTAIEAMAAEVMRTRLARGTAKLVRPSAARLRALAVLSESNLLGTAEDVTTALMRAVSQFILTTTPSPRILDTLAEVMSKELGQVQTLFDTQVSIMGRQVEAIATEPLGPEQAFLYTGPVDGRTRTWCLDRVGKVYTRREIEAMDNGQLPNAFLTGGGYNCRHSFLAVASDELVSLTGMNLRAPGFEEEIASAKAQQRQARRSDRQRRARGVTT